jgi:hypothetical protein
LALTLKLCILSVPWEVFCKHSCAFCGFSQLCLNSPSDKQKRNLCLVYCSVNFLFFFAKTVSFFGIFILMMLDFPHFHNWIISYTINAGLEILSTRTTNLNCFVKRYAIVICTETKYEKDMSMWAHLLY